MATSKETPNAVVKVTQLPTIKGDNLNYVTIEKDNKKVDISIGEKNYKALIELLKP